MNTDKHHNPFNVQPRPDESKGEFRDRAPWESEEEYLAYRARFGDQDARAELAVLAEEQVRRNHQLELASREQQIRQLETEGGHEREVAELRERLAAQRRTFVDANEL